MERHGVDDGAVAVEEIGAEVAGGQLQVSCEECGSLVDGSWYGTFWDSTLRTVLTGTKRDWWSTQVRIDQAQRLLSPADGCCAAAFAGFGGLHLERVVEAVEVVEEADGAEQFDDLRLRNRSCAVRRIARR